MLSDAVYSILYEQLKRQSFCESLDLDVCQSGFESPQPDTDCPWNPEGSMQMSSEETVLRKLEKPSTRLVRDSSDPISLASNLYSGYYRAVCETT